MPGRSLSAKTTGRSCAPVATTTERARMRHTRWRERCFGADAPRWSVRRSSASTNPSSYAPNAVVRCRCSTSGYAASSATAAATQSSAGAPSSRSVPDSSAPPASDCSSTSATRAPARAALSAAASPRAPRPPRARRRGGARRRSGRSPDVGQPPLARQMRGRRGRRTAPQWSPAASARGTARSICTQAAGVLRPGRGDAARAAEPDARADPVRRPRRAAPRRGCRRGARCSARRRR